jgi:hypothetical protein
VEKSMSEEYVFSILQVALLPVLNSDVFIPLNRMTREVLKETWIDLKAYEKTLTVLYENHRWLSLDYVKNFEYVNILLKNDISLCNVEYVKRHDWMKKKC